MAPSRSPPKFNHSLVHDLVILNLTNIWPLLYKLSWWQVTTNQKRDKWQWKQYHLFHKLQYHAAKACDILRRWKVNQGEVVRPSAVWKVIMTYCWGTRRQCWQQRLQITQSIAIKWKHEKSRIGIGRVTNDVMECSIHMLFTHTCTRTHQCIQKIIYASKCKVCQLRSFHAQSVMHAFLVTIAKLINQSLAFLCHTVTLISC